MSAGHSRRDVLGYAFRCVAFTGLACSGFACTGLVPPVAEAAATTLPLPDPWDVTEGRFFYREFTFADWFDSGDYDRWVQTKSEDFDYVRCRDRAYGIRGPTVAE
jgi:hypothetical protein